MENMWSGLFPEKAASDQALLLEGMQQAEVAISLYDSELRLVMCNATFRDIFNLPETMTVPGAPLEPMLRFLAEQRAYGEVDVDKFIAAALLELREMTIPLSRERRVGDGRIFLSHTSRLDSGGYITVHTDISYYKEAETALLEMVGDLEACLDGAAIGVCKVVRESAMRHVLRRANAALENLLGYGRGELAGSDLQRLFDGAAEGEQAIQELTQASLRGQTHCGQHRLRRKDGSVLAVLVKAIPRGAGISVWTFEPVAAQTM